MKTKSRGRRQPDIPAPTSHTNDLEALAGCAWRERGIVILFPDRIRDDWDRQHVLNLAGKLYGPRVTMVPMRELIPLNRRTGRRAVRS